MTGPILEAIGSGSLVGFTLGLIGGGGSILATPLLLYVVGVSSPHVAIGTGALAVSVNAYANLLGHARKGHVWWRCAIVFALVGAEQSHVVLFPRELKRAIIDRVNGR